MTRSEDTQHADEPRPAPPAQAPAPAPAPRSDAGREAAQNGRAASENDATGPSRAAGRAGENAPAKPATGTNAETNQAVPAPAAPPAPDDEPRHAPPDPGADASAAPATSANAAPDPAAPAAPPGPAPRAARRRRRPASKPRKRRGVLAALAPWLLVLGGLLLLARPIITDWLYALEAEDAIQEIVSTYDDMSDPERLENLDQARAWNARLRGEDPGLDLWDYDWQLTYKSTPKSMMAWVDIPKIGTRLPIYHGTEQAALAAGVGHCDWSALPVGGPGRCVLTAHSGMQRTRMFDDIRLLELGDTFVIWSLGEPHAYRVDDIQIILPTEVEGLRGSDGRDLCTLVTCTPYGVNSHRLLVTGVRCAYVAEEMGETATVEQFVNRRTIPLLVGIGVLALLLTVLVVRRVRRGRRRRAAAEAAAAAGRPVVAPRPRGVLTWLLDLDDPDDLDDLSDLDDPPR